MEAYRHFTSLGWFLVIIGLILVALPYIARVFPVVDKLPWYIWWSYKSNGFYFGTSPLLIFISLVSLFWSILQR